MIRYLKNERGDSVVPFTGFFVMAMVILLALLMMWISAEITFIGIRNSVKNELTNVSIRISEDTYKAMREGNLNAYYETLTSDDFYQAELQQMIRENIASAMPLETSSYHVEDIALTFQENGDNIEYVLTCNVEYYVSLFGYARTIRAEEIELSGRHNIKGY